MAQGIVTLRFNENNPYTDDRGTQRFGSTRFGIPNPLAGADNATLEGIATIGGAQVKAVKGQIVNDIPDAVCPEASANFRRMQFLLNDGSSLSLPIATRSNLTSTAQSIADAINGAADDARVICIKLLGEVFRDLMDELGAEFQNDVVQEDITSNKYSGYTESNYVRDAGTETVISVQINSPNENAPPTTLQSAWEDCVGDLVQNSKVCGGGTRRLTPRSYTAFYQIEDNNTTSHKVPILNSEGSDIQSCGESIVSNVQGALFCISYEGESDSRLHLRQGIDLSNG
jgi:hypothetical protein